MKTFVKVITKYSAPFRNTKNGNKKAVYRKPYTAILIYYLTSTINFIAVLLSPSTSTDEKEGVHTRSMPLGAT